MRKRDSEEIFWFFGKIRGCLLIVEGKKDVNALNTLGLTDILAISGKPLIEVTRRVIEMRANKQYSDIIILTDFDKEGRRLAGNLSRLLRAHKVHPNQRLRSCVMKFGFNKIEDIKLDSILKIGKERRCDVHVKTSTNINKVRDKGLVKGKRGR